MRLMTSLVNNIVLTGKLYRMYFESNHKKGIKEEKGFCRYYLKFFSEDEKHPLKVLFYLIILLSKTHILK